MGQNLAASAGFKQTGPEVVGAWMSEEKDYNPASPSYSHFTRKLPFLIPLLLMMDLVGL